jgi:cell division protein FtsW
MTKYLDYLKGDRVIWIITLIMLAFSLVSVYSFVPILVKMEGGTPFKYLFKHFVYVLIGLGLLIWISRQEPKYFSMLSKLGFYIAIALLIFTFFFATKSNNAGRWVRIPFVGLTFQSSDFAKLALVVYLSRLMVKKKDLMDSWKEGFWPIMMPIIIVCGLIIKDNFSTAAILFCICLVMLFIGKVPFGKIAIMLGGGIILFAAVVGLHKALPEVNLLPRLETWENRIFNRMDNGKNVAANAQANNAKLAIYNGGTFGEGVGDGKLKEFLPEAYADFYYATFVEEFGLMSALFLILCYLILLFRIIKIALRSDRLFETYACIGIGVLMLSMATVNMLVCVGIFPVTGQNMPLLAMGGSALITTCAGLGIVQSIAHKQLNLSKEA